MPTSFQSDYRVLVLAPFGKDAVLVREVLERSGIPVGVVANAGVIARCVAGGAGVAVVAEEALDREGIRLLGHSVAAQPAWSDFPIIVLTGGGATTPYTEQMVRSRTPMGNINLIERPLRPATTNTRSSSGSHSSMSAGVSNGDHAASNGNSAA